MTVVLIYVRVNDLLNVRVTVQELHPSSRTTSYVTRLSGTWCRIKKRNDYLQCLVATVCYTVLLHPTHAVYNVIMCS